MMLMLENYSIALIIALLIGLVTAWWAFKRAASARTFGEAPQPLEVPIPAAPQQPGAAIPGAVPTDVLEVETPLAIPTTEGPPDDLRMMKGVGAKLVAQLNAEGITRFDQLARLSPAELALLDDRMGAFRGRLVRDRVAEQAALLARGDRAGFEAEFGKLGSGA